MRLSNEITPDEYADKKNELDAHGKADDNFITTVESMLLLASRAGELFKSSKVEQKREIVNLLLSNCTLKDKKLGFSLRKPFDALVNLNNRKLWSVNN